MRISLPKKSLKIALAILAILILGGVGGFLFDYWALPRLQGLPIFSEDGWFRKATDRTTIINRTEQVVIREDDTVERIISQPATAVVNIISVPESAAAEGTVPEPFTARTGVLLTNDGLMVTYASEEPASAGVVNHALLFDGKSHPAAYVGYDRLANLAYFRLTENVSVPAIALANSDDSRIGRRLIAIGNSFADYQNRISVGVLGNNDRTFNLSGQTVSFSDKWEGVFEMDLGDAQDFVGAPVIGYNGEMVGMVGAVSFDGSVRDFLLPSNLIRASYERIENGRVPARPSLGVYYLPITKALALGENLPRDRGALVYSPSGTTGLAVLANSPAARAGIQVGDIITAVNGEEVNLDRPLPELLSRFEAGASVELTVLRNGSELTLPVTL